MSTLHSKVSHPPNAQFRNCIGDNQETTLIRVTGNALIIPSFEPGRYRILLKMEDMVASHSTLRSVYHARGGY